MPTNIDLKLKAQLRTAKQIRRSAERSRKVARSGEPNQKRKPGYSARFV